MPKKPIYRFVQGDEYIDDIVRNKQLWLAEPIIPIGGRVNVYGQPKKARKSYLMLGLSHAISTGQPSWLGFPIKKSGPVLYLQADTPDPLWAQRMRDLRSAGYDMDEMWVASLATMPYPFNINEHEEILNGMITAVPGEPVMIVFDTGAAMHTMNENQSQDMTVFIQALDRVAGKQARVLITHDRKGGFEKPEAESEEDDREGGDLMRGSRGSSALAGAVDTVIKVSPKGTMYYQGRAVGEEHKKLRFLHAHNDQHPCPHPSPRQCMAWLWHEDLDEDVVEAKRLIELYKNGSERSLARQLAKRRGMPEETARSVIRRQKEKL